MKKRAFNELPKEFIVKNVSGKDLSFQLPSSQTIDWRITVSDEFVEFNWSVPALIKRGDRFGNAIVVYVEGRRIATLVTYKPGFINRAKRFFMFLRCWIESTDRRMREEWK